MNFRRNKGFASIDISITMIVILIFIPTIFGIVYNIQKTNNEVERKSQAVNIGIDVLELAKSMEYNQIELDNDTENKQFLESLNNNYDTSDYRNTNTEEDGYKYMYYTATGKRNEHYQIQIGLKNYYPSDIEEDKKEDLVKQLKVRVIYPVGKSQKDVDFSMTLQNT